MLQLCGRVAMYGNLPVSGNRPARPERAVNKGIVQSADLPLARTRAQAIASSKLQELIWRAQPDATWHFGVVQGSSSLGLWTGYLHPMSAPTC